MAIFWFLFAFLSYFKVEGHSPSVSVTSSHANPVRPHTVVMLIAEAMPHDPWPCCSFSWKQASATPTLAVIDAPFAPVTKISGLSLAGDYLFTLTVSDSTGQTTTVQTLIRVVLETMIVSAELELRPESVDRTVTGVTAPMNLGLAEGSASAETMEEGTCLFGSDEVRLRNGRTLKIRNLKTDSAIMAVHENGSIHASDVQLSLHGQNTRVSPFLEIRTFYDRIIRVTPGHLVFKAPSCLVNKFSQNQAIPAEDLRVHDCIYAHSRKKKAIVLDRIQSIVRRRRPGIYAPLTNSGTLIVNDVVVSSYAFLPSQELAHAVFQSSVALNDRRELEKAVQRMSPAKFRMFMLALGRALESSRK